MPPAPQLRLRISPTAESILRGGHPWLFAESIRGQNRDGQVGELAVIYDRKNRFLGIGLFDPDGPIRVRMLHTGKPQTVDRTWWQHRLATALDRRRQLFDDQTNGYRLCNGESDGWPGLVLDRYDTTLVLKLYTAAWLPRLDEMVDLIGAQVPHERIVLRLSRNIRDRALPLADGQALRGSALASPVIFMESGLRFEADVVRGQKTGFFLDQRDNRRLVGTLARARHMLNVFSFAGGFSIHAARGGAVSVTDLDISGHALEAAKHNFALNRSDPAIGRCRHETIQADAFEWLGEAARRFHPFDLIVVDPPSLAKRESERAEAIRTYGRLADSAIRLLHAPGLLVASSCSAHVTAEEFLGAVRTAARNSGRRHEELRTTGHPPDHPATFPEANYLKTIYLRVD